MLCKGKDDFKMMVSLIIPVYNAAPYLRACLDSVLVQTFTDWEMICIDDGSADGSGEILDEYMLRDTRIRVFHQDNAGSSAARNKGLEYASGEWVWFVDADDTITPSALETLVNVKPKADVIFLGVNRLYQDGFVEVKIPADAYAGTEEEINRLVEKLYGGVCGDIFGWTCLKVIRRSVLEENKIRFNESIALHEDLVFTIQCMNCVKTAMSISVPLYNYRILDTGLTAKGISDPYALVIAFMQASGGLRRHSLYAIINGRVTAILRRLIWEKHSFYAASMMIDFKKCLSGHIVSCGVYERLCSYLIRLPRWIAAMLLLFVHLMKR